MLQTERKTPALIMIVFSDISPTPFCSVVFQYLQLSCLVLLLVVAVAVGGVSICSYVVSLE